MSCEIPPVVTIMMRVERKNGALTTGWLWAASLQLSLPGIKLLLGVNTEEGLREKNLESSWFHECWSASSQWLTRESGHGPFSFPHSKNKMRVHAWRYSLIWECWEQTHSRVHVKPTVSHHVRPRGLIDEVSRDWGWGPGLEDVRAHAPVLPLLRLPVTSLVHKALFSCDWVPPLVKPQWLVAFVFSACKTKHRCYSNCGRFHQRTHTDLSLSSLSDRTGFTHLYMRRYQ